MNLHHSAGDYNFGLGLKIRDGEDMAKPVIEAPLEVYEKYSFMLTAKDDCLDVRVTDVQSKGLAISCSLNIGIWGQNGAFLVDPDEDGLRIHIPNPSSPFSKPEDSKTRKSFVHGLWFVDVVYALGRKSTGIVEKEIDPAFEISYDKDGALVIKRKFVHAMYQYRWPYVARIHRDGRLRIILERPLQQRIIKPLSQMLGTAFT